jgi:hypothetical protein
LNPSKTLAQKGFAMKSSLTSLPKGVYGQLVVNIKTVAPKDSKLQYDEHFVATLEQSGKDGVNAKLHLYSLDKRAKGRKMMARLLATLPFDAVDRKGIPTNEIEVKAIITRLIWREFEQWWGVQDTLNRTIEYCELTYGTWLRPELRELFVPQFALPGTETMIVPGYVHTNVPVGEYGSPDTAFIPATEQPPAPVVRLSKEEWLKQHYPEMTELPKWRFPACA